MIFHHNALADLDQLNLDDETPRALPRQERAPHLQHLSRRHVSIVPGPIVLGPSARSSLPRGAG
jgi:hypothetical protein